MKDRSIKSKSNKYYLNEKNKKIKRIIKLAKMITAEGGGDVKFIKQSETNNDIIDKAMNNVYGSKWKQMVKEIENK